MSPPQYQCSPSLTTRCLRRQGLDPSEALYSVLLTAESSALRRLMADRLSQQPDQQGRRLSQHEWLMLHLLSLAELGRDV